MRWSSGLALWLLAACACAGEISVEWIAPTENEDGTPLTDLAGYRVYYGPASGSYASVFEVGDPTATTATVPNVFPGDYYVAMTALDADGNESTYSNEILKSVPAIVLPGAATLAANGEWLVDPPQPPPGGGDVAGASDTFGTPSNPISGLAEWGTNKGENPSPAEVTSLGVQNSSTQFTNWLHAYALAPFSEDHTVTVDLVRGGNTNSFAAFGAVARLSGADGSGQAYYLRTRTDGVGGPVELYKVSGGAAGPHVAKSVASDIEATSLRLVVEGDRVLGYFSETGSAEGNTAVWQQVIDYTDPSPLAGGAPGIGGIGRLQSGYGYLSYWQASTIPATKLLPLPYSRSGAMKPLGKVEVDRSNPWGARLVFGVTFSESGPANLGGTALNGAPANNVARDITGHRQATHAIGGTVINRRVTTNLSSALPKNSNRVYQQQIDSISSAARYGFEYGDERNRSYSMVDEINDAGGDWMVIARVRRYLDQHSDSARIFSLRRRTTGDEVALGVLSTNQPFGRHDNTTFVSDYIIPDGEWVTLITGRAGGNRFVFTLEDDTTVRGYEQLSGGSDLELTGASNEVGVGTMAGQDNGRFFRGEIDYVYLFKGVTDLRDEGARVAAARQVAQAPWQFLRPAAPAPVLTIPAAGGGITLSVDGAIHGHTAEVIALTQKGTVSVAESLHAHTADNLVLGVGAAVPLAVSRAWNLQDGGDGRGDMLPSMGGGTLSAYPIGPTSFLWPHRFVITNPSASWRVVSSVSLDGTWTFGPGPNASFDRGAQTGVASFDYEILNGNAAGDTFTGTHTVSVQ